MVGEVVQGAHGVAKEPDCEVHRPIERANGTVTGVTRSLTLRQKLTSVSRSVGGRSSAWLEPQIVDLVVAGSNPVGHPIFSDLVSGALPALPSYTVLLLPGGDLLRNLPPHPCPLPLRGGEGARRA